MRSISARHISVVAMAVFALTATLFAYLSVSTTAQSSKQERSLEIEHYANQPVELVDVKASGLSVKSRAQNKFNSSNGRIDTLKLNGKNDWYKHITVTLRNVSEKPIHGLRVSLFVRHDGSTDLYELPLTYAKSLKEEPLQHGAEVNMAIDERVSKPILDLLMKHPQSEDVPWASLAVEAVSFGDDLQWRKGSYLRRVPNDPNKWETIEAASERGANWSSKPVGSSQFTFQKISFSPVVPAIQSNTQCQDSVGGFLGYSCVGGGSRCNRLEEFGNGQPGALSTYTVTGLCTENFEVQPSECQQTTTHTRFRTDASCPPPPPPTPTPTPEPCEYDTSEGAAVIGGGQFVCDTCWDGIDNDCDGQLDFQDYGCQGFPCNPSPIVIDTIGDGIRLTNAQGGVQFDINADGRRDNLAWTVTSSDDVWLALDRDGNGTIDNGQELFGNFTPQPNPPAGEERQGFLALAEYDKVTNGGNGDGSINRSDSIFSSLRLWQDINHNGISETEELKTLPTLGVARLDLDYRESRRTDEHGNQFKYRAKIRDARGAQVGRWAWDVFLVRRQ